MRISVLSILFVLIVSTYTSGLWFNLQKAKYENYNNEKTIFVPCEGGSGRYRYEYRGLDKGLYATNNKIYIPGHSFKQGGFFGVRVTVFDLELEIHLRRVLIFQISLNKIEELYETDYNFKFETESNILDFINNQRRKHSLRVSNFEVSRTSGSSSSSSSSSSFSSFTLPSDQEVDDVVGSGNVGSIQKLINEVLNSSLGCETKAQFLSDLLSRIQRFIALFRTSAQNLRQTIFILKQQIRELTLQLQELKSTTIDIEFLKNQLVQTERELRRVSGAISSDTIEVQTLEQSITSIQVDIFDLKTITISRAENQIVQHNRRIGKIDIQIEDLQNQIQRLRRQRTEVADKRSELRVVVNEARSQIQSLTAQIRSVRTNISQISARIQKNTQIRKSIEIRIERLQRQIREGGQNNSQRIIVIEREISEKTSTISSHEREISTFEALYQKLERSLDGFIKIIDRHYYRCYEVIDDEDEFEDEGFIPVFHSSAFLGYLERLYGHVDDTLIRSRFSGTGQINLKKFNIFSPAWIRVYGIPFSAGYGNNMDLMERQFSCTVTQNLEVFKGVILSITSNVIVVKENNTNQQYTVHLGGCTRLETATATELPEVGDFIHWKGNRREGNNRHYNAFEATCY